MFPARLGPYRIVRKIGRGGMGTVYLGVDDGSGQTAAVKLLTAEMAQQFDFRERFKAEIETLRKLNHPNIVRIFGFGEEEQQFFYAMEFVAGSSLEDQLARGRVFSWREVARFGWAVARALRHAHDRGIIHRDIKPGNLLLTEDGVLKLSDFGIARLFGNTRLTGAGSVLGTAEFMAPEQAEGRPVEPRSDLYSLGGVMYVLLARRPLYDARSFVEMLDKQRFEMPAPLRQLAPETPMELEQIVHRLLEKDPQRRLGTAMVLERRLETMMQSFGVSLSSGAAPVAVESAPESPRAGGDPLPINPLALTVAVTQISDEPPPPMPAAPQVIDGEPDRGLPPISKAAMPGASPPVAARFIPVRPGELDQAPQARPAAVWISPQTWGLAIGLLAIGLLGWYLLRPPSSDALFRRIQRQTASGSAESLEQAEDDIHQFLVRFPSDPRGEGLNNYLEQIELSRLERRLELQAKGVRVQTPLSPVEQSCLDALIASRTDLEAGMAKFQAVIDLYDSPNDLSGPRRRCVQLAKRRLAEIRRQHEVQSREQLAAVRQRIERADALRKSDPQRAAAIYRAVIVLYENKAWAKDLARRARLALGQGQSDQGPLPPAAP